MDLLVFLAKIAQASDALLVVCKNGRPTEEQVRTVTRQAGLPISFEDDSLASDPVRTAVMINAYRVKGLVMGVNAMKTAWEWVCKNKLVKEIKI